MVPAPVVEMESKMQTLTGMVIVEVIEGIIFLIALGLGWFCLAVSYERRLLRARLELEAINGAAGWEAVVGKHWLDEIKTSPGDDWISRAAIATAAKRERAVICADIKRKQESATAAVIATESAS